MITFFLRRPIFAAVCSLIIFTAGIVAIPTLPISEYPKIAPPVVTVSAQYLGADAASVEALVAVTSSNGDRRTLRVVTLDGSSGDG